MFDFPDFSKIPEHEHIPFLENMEDIKSILEEERAARIAAEKESQRIKWKERLIGAGITLAVWGLQELIVWLLHK